MQWSDVATPPIDKDGGDGRALLSVIHRMVGEVPVDRNLSKYSILAFHYRLTTWSLCCIYSLQAKDDLINRSLCQSLFCLSISSHIDFEIPGAQFLLL